MKSYREVLELVIPERRQFVNITPRIEQALQKKRRQGRPLPCECHAYYSQRLYQRR
jgi:hypothetical protein